MAPSRVEALQAARDMLGLSVPRLWLDYVGLGGNLPPAMVQAVLEGRAPFDDYDHDLLVQALNERFIDMGENHPVAYADEIQP